LEYDAVSLTEIGGGSEFLRAVRKQEHVVERVALRGITKLRVDGSRAITVVEALAATAVGAGAKRAGACSSCGELFF
jgi:hypothetical protein